MNAFRARREAKGRIDLLPPEPKTPARRNAKPFPARLEVVDADFVVIRTSNDNHRTVRAAPSDARPHQLMLRLAAAGARGRRPGRALLLSRRALLLRWPLPLRWPLLLSGRLLLLR